MSISNIVAFRCPLCFEVFETPIGLLCGHTFCRGCLLNCVPANAHSHSTDDSIVPDVEAIPAHLIRNADLASSISSIDGGRGGGGGGGGGGMDADGAAGDGVLGDAVAVAGHGRARPPPRASPTGQCPVCFAPLPPPESWQQNFAIAAAIEEVGRVLTNVILPAELTDKTLIRESSICRVYRAVLQGSSSTPKSVAVKVYKADVDDREKQRQRTEFNLLRSLRHDNVVLFIGVVESPFSVVTEFADRGSLRDFLSSGVIYTPATVVRLARGIVAGMEYLHAQRVMHRSLRPENVLVTSDYRALISDFRVSSMITLCQSLSSAGGEMDRRVLPSLAPERLRGEPYSWQADAWSFGITLYELVTRRAPYGGVADSFGIIQAIVAGERPPIPAEVPEAFARIIEACWAAEPARRPSFAQLGRALDAINL
jgi:tRNA A-37 threonylcarbamoyl transferase component Bud32